MNAYMQRIGKKEVMNKFLNFWDTRRWIKSKSTIRSILTHHRQNPTERSHGLFQATILTLTCKNCG